MRTLDDAWAWYVATKKQSKLVRKLADKHWDQLPNDPLLDPNRESVIRDAVMVHEPLDDLAVLVLFSVFEAIVRKRLADEIAIERQILKHPVLVASATDAADAIEFGSFARVLDP